MKKKTGMQRTLTLLDPDGTTRNVVLGFSAPTRNGHGDVDVITSLTGLESPWSVTVTGVDAVQATELALRTAVAKIESLEEYQSGRLYFLEPRLGHGLVAGLAARRRGARRGSRSS